MTDTDDLFNLLSTPGSPLPSTPMASPPHEPSQDGVRHAVIPQDSRRRHFKPYRRSLMPIDFPEPCPSLFRYSRSGRVVSPKPWFHAHQWCRLVCLGSGRCE
ncbi:hypothetical protein TNCT_124131 [Trichonephila clavata]|uniref:Uncharacterized protein n=1 Tax=Trichonephila clavata TaxID=2740835 RepID=A0A8X6FWQ4_TRICU|nr:hypothetical protein TNCT_124131 [Trichonephila clavata]